MKKDYYYKIYDFGNLYKALKQSCRNVRWKDSVVGYENNGFKNVKSLQNDLKSGKYKIQKYQTFVINEPKYREITATRIRDRQVQRCLCNIGLYEDITEHFINDNVACQKGKGTDYALKRMKTHLHRYYKKYGKNGYVLKCDIHHFFPSTNHEVARNKIEKYVSDKEAAQMVYKIIDSFGIVGIGLGSEISQLIELLVLNDLDHFIKEKLKIKYYIRYMDDFILIHPSKEYLKYCKTEIEKQLSDLKLELNKKTSLFPLKQGITFLQWKFVYSDTGKILMFISRKKVYREKRRLIKILHKESKGLLPKGTARTSLKCWMANAKRGNTYKIQNMMINFYNGKVEEIYMNEQYHQKKLQELVDENIEGLISENKELKQIVQEQNEALIELASLIEGENNG